MPMFRKARDLAKGDLVDLPRRRQPVTVVDVREATNPAYRKVRWVTGTAEGDDFDIETAVVEANHLYRLHGEDN